jgi:hypothetical protein
MDALQKEFMVRAEQLQAALKHDVLQRKLQVAVSLIICAFINNTAMVMMVMIVTY